MQTNTPSTPTPPSHLHVLLSLTLSLLILPTTAFSTQTSDTCTTTTNNNSPINPSQLRETISSGRVYRHPDFLSESEVQTLLREITQLQQSDRFLPSGLSDKQKKSQNFGKSDRIVSPVPWWNDSLLGGGGGADDDEGVGQQQSDDVIRIGTKLQRLRKEVSSILNRPSMMSDDDPTKLQHECYYSQSTIGAVLQRHMDERHEEMKGARGWLLPSRRSISWLVYLSDDDWDSERNGGALRYYPQRTFRGTFGRVECGCHDGNLQIGWRLRDYDDDDNDGSVISLPVFLDSWYEYPTKGDEAHCILYIVREDGQKRYITRPWINEGRDLSTLLPDLAKIDCLEDKTQFFVNREEASQFRLLEDRTLWSEGTIPDGSEVVDVPPTRGMLVMFDSVSVPHEVMLVKNGKRAAIAGWFHEKTQFFMG